MKAPSKTTKSNHAAAAAAIRAELKRRGIAGTVRSRSYAGGSSITVQVTDLPWRVAVDLKVFCSEYQQGSFDSMEDCYRYDNRREGLPQVQYVFVENRASDSLRARIWDYCISHYGISNADPSTFIPAMDCYGDVLIGRVFDGRVSDFWSA